MICTSGINKEPVEEQIENGRSVDRALRDTGAMGSESKKKNHIGKKYIWQRRVGVTTPHIIFMHTY